MARLTLHNLTQSTEGSSRRRGVYLAIVTANTDEGSDSRHRVKVRFPWLPDGETSYWARILTPMAGASRGTYFLPEVDDQVLVVFEHGDVSRPIIVGSLWSSVQPPPQRNDDGQNNIKVIKSKSGHRLIFDDTSGSERITVVDSTRRNKIVLDSGGDSITIQSAGDIDLIANTGKVAIHGKTVKLTTSAALKGQGPKVAISGMTLDMGAQGETALRGGSIMLNPGGPPAAAQQQNQDAGNQSRGAQDALDQVREAREAARSAEAAVATAIFTSPALRVAASIRNLPDHQNQPPATVGARPGQGGQGGIRPGEPVEVSCITDANQAEYVVRDSDTGEEIERGPCRVEGGQATATWDSKALEDHPETESVDVEIHAEGSQTSTGPMPVAGRGQPVGAASPSNALADPSAPMPERQPGVDAASPGPSAPTAAVGGAGAAAPTVDHRGRAVDAPVADHRTPSADAAAAAPGVRDHSGGAPDAPGVRDHTGGAPDAPSVRDHTSGAPDAPDPASAASGAGGAEAGGHDAKVGHAAVAASEGDAAGATGYAAGGQAGAAARGDAAGAVGGGTAGRVASGDLEGAAVAESGADSRVAHVDSADDAEAMAEGEARARGREASGLGEAERQKSQAENQVAGEQRDLEHQADVEGRAEGEVYNQTSDARSEQYRAEGELRGAQSDATDVPGESDLQGAKNQASSEQFKAERELDRPENEVRGARYEAESQAGDARDPGGAAERDVRDHRSEVGEAESQARDVERTADDPDRAAKDEVKKIDED